MKNVLSEAWRKRLFPLIDNPEGLRFSLSNKRFEVVVAGRRCLEAGTMVATPCGPVPIEQIRPGDIVFGYNADGGISKTAVINFFNNGIQAVYPFFSSNKKIVAATELHKFWACNESFFDSRKQSIKYKESCQYKKRPVGQLSKRYRVKKEYLFDFFEGGKKHVKNAYSLGAFIGNGCCLQGSITTGAQTKYLYISDEDGIVAHAVAKEMGGYAEKQHESNYTWKICGVENVLDAIPFYREWCCMRYAHEKIADWNEIDTWNKDSAMAFLAGVFDTDGSVFYKNKEQVEAVIQIGMQAKSVVEVCQKIIYKYFQEDLTIFEDSREKYKNGNVFFVKTSSNLLSKRLYLALLPYLKKRNNFNLEHLELRNILPDRIGMKKGEPYLAATYDITVDNDTNLYVLHNCGLVTSNSGKTERAKRKFIQRILAGSKHPRPRYVAAAPTIEQSRRIFLQDICDMLPSFLISKINKSTSSILLTTGAEILIAGLDNPARAEGSPIDGMIIDETDDLKPRVLEEHIYPCFTDRQAFCMFLGVPNGLKLLYELSKNALIEPKEWDFFTWPSSEVLPAAELERFRRIYDENTFNQEFNASFVTFSGRVAYDFGRANYKHELVHYLNKPLEICWDFNNSPGIAAIVQEQVMPGQYELFNTGSEIIKSQVIGSGVIGEVWIPRHSNTILVCRKIYEDWKHHKGEIIFYGDPAGGQQKSSGIAGSDWDLVQNFFKQTEWANRISYDIPRAHPSVRSRINAMNCRIKSIDGIIRFMVDPVAAPHVVEDFERLTVLEGSNGEIDKKSNKAIGHLFDAVSYREAQKYPVDDENRIIKVCDF